MMRRYLIAVVAAVCLAMSASNAHAIGADFSAKEIAAMGKHCVHGYWVNELTSFYFRGDAAAFNEHIKKLDAEQMFPVTWASRKVILHIGPKKAASPWDKAPRDIACDWNVTAWMGDGPKPNEGPYPMNRQIDVWLGGNLKLEDLKIPADYEVVSGGEIEAFLGKRKKSE